MLSILAAAGDRACADTVTTTVYTGHTDTGSTILFSGTVAGTVSTPSVMFDTNTGGDWRPFGLSAFGADIVSAISVATAGSYTFTAKSDDGSSPRLPCRALSPSLSFPNPSIHRPVPGDHLT
jgi:hypothetical protein